MTRIPRVVIAGTTSGAGKTTVATGLMAALRAAGHRVAGFKVGPDFIDPSYHQLATGRPSRNLDAVLSGPALLGPLLAHGAAGADLAVIEGVMGLFDGASRRPDDEDDPDPAARLDGPRVPFASTAHVARLLAAPIVLVVDAAATAASIGATVHGFATYEPSLQVAGVIANRVGSDRHEAMVREAVATVGLPVLGVLRRDEGLVTPSRHLGLVPVAERTAEARHTVADMGARVGAAVDLTALVALARRAPDLAVRPWQPPSVELTGDRAPNLRSLRSLTGASGDRAPHLRSLRSLTGAPGAQGPRRPRIAVAGGPAFSFTYAENVELLTAAGAEVVPLDPLADPALPERTAGLYLGGGFPEAHGAGLSANAALRSEVAAAAAAGLPVLAECGGLLYLCRSLDGLPMCGVLDATARMADRLTLGYRQAQAMAEHPVWRAGDRARGHEFHHSVVEPGAGAAPAWRLDGRAEGFVAGGVHASYLHTHWAATPQVAQRFVAAAAAHDDHAKVTT